MAPIRRAVEHTLARHAPYPALAIDRLWRVIRMNAPAKMMFAPLAVGEGDSLLELLLSDALPAVIGNWPQFAHHAAQRLLTESAAQGGVPELDQVARTLAGVAGASDMPIGPVAETIYELGSVRLSLITTIAQFGTPRDLTVDDLKLEMFFPADAATAELLHQMAARNAT